jgi:hypothetical protein
MLHVREEALTMSMLDPEAAQLLRRAIQLGDPGRTTVKDLRLAVEHPVPIELPPSRLRGDAPLAQLLRRAMEIARTQSRETVSRADLIEALVEAEAVAAGLDLDRLRFARFCVERAHAVTRPALRRVGERVTAPSDGSSA